MDSRVPSGLFPSGPPRPAFREPHPIRVGAVLAGAGGGVVWLLLFGLLATSLFGYLWLTIVASATAWLAALGLARWGDRGVAAGVVIATAVGLSVAFVIVVEEWGSSGWPLW